MGLERIAAVLQGKTSNYETDLIQPVMAQAAELCSLAMGSDARIDTALRIAADHGRAAAFLINDGVLPSNEGRGYVLRKIMRRAMRNMRMVGVEEPFLYKLTGFVAELMQGPYPEMMESVQRVARVVKDEEHRYATTFLTAEKEFNQAIQQVTDHIIPGAVAFKLYDTYGLALDEQEDMAREHGLTIDRDALRTRDGAAAGARPRQLEGRGERRGGPGLPETAGAGADEVSGIQRHWKPPRASSACCARSSWWKKSPRALDGEAGLRPDAVLCRDRRAGGRPRRALFGARATKWPMWKAFSPAFRG